MPAHRDRLSKDFDDKSRTSLCGSTGLRREGKSKGRIVAPFHLLSISHTRYFIRGRSKRKGTLAPRACPQTLIIACREDANRERGRRLSWEQTMTQGGRPPPFFLFPSRNVHFHILAFIELCGPARYYMNIITEYIFYGTADWRRDGSIGRAQREARAQLHKVPSTMGGEAEREK